LLDKRIILITFHSIALILLVSLACTTPTGIYSLIRNPSKTPIDIQEIVKETLSAYTEIAIEVDTNNDGTPIIDLSSTPAFDNNPTDGSTILPDTETQIPLPSLTPTPEFRGTCFQDNPYFPIRDDVTWQYHTQPTEKPINKYTVQFGSITKESFIVYKKFDTFNSLIEWLCSSDGLIQSKYIPDNIPGTPEGIQFETTEYSGITFPSPDKFQEGEEWRSKYVLQGTMVTDVGNMITITDVIITHTLSVMEKITVPLGSYENAARVDSKVTMLIHTQIGGVAGPATEIDFDISTWYVEEIGMVKSITYQQGEGKFTELVSIK
jgi:hypothetical protein